MSACSHPGNAGHALISASDLSWLLENSNLQLLQGRIEQLPARLLQRVRRQRPVAPCCQHALRARSHALHAAAAE